MLLVGLFLFLAEIYAAFLVIFLIVKSVRRKKIPWAVVVANGLCIVLLLWLKYKVQNHEIIFAGNYSYGGDDWGEGLANVGVTLGNLGIVYLIILATQIVFVIIFSRESKKMKSDRTDSLSF